MADSTCRWPGCDGPVKTRGLCNRDYHRARRVGDLDAPWTIWQHKREPGRPCKWPGCESRKIRGHNLCLKHYKRGEALGDFQKPWEQWQPNVCGFCGVTFQGRNRITRFCSPECNLEDWKIRNPARMRELGRRSTRIRRARLKQVQAETFTEADVRLMWGDDCYLCGKAINFKLRNRHPLSPSLDHVIPLSKGGSHTLANVAITHLSCNVNKAARLIEAAPRATLLTM